MKNYITPEITLKKLIEKKVMLDLFIFSDVIADLGEEEETNSEGEE